MRCGPLHISIEQVLKSHCIDVLICTRHHVAIDLVLSLADEPKHLSHSVPPLPLDFLRQAIVEGIGKLSSGSFISGESAPKVWVPLDEVDIWVSEQSIQKAHYVEFLI